MRLALYCRGSTSDQSLDPQLDTLRTYASARGLDVSYNVLASIAEFERDLNRERTRAGLRAAQRRGRRLGRPEALDARERARVRRLAAAGRSQREIAETLGIGKGTVHRVLAEAPRKGRREVDVSGP